MYRDLAFGFPHVLDDLPRHFFGADVIASVGHSLLQVVNFLEALGIGGAVSVVSAIIPDLNRELARVLCAVLRVVACRRRRDRLIALV